MSELDEAYQKLVEGGDPADLKPNEPALLLARAGRASRSDSIDERLAGLKVAGAIGGKDGIATISAFQRDPDVGVRRAAFNLGVEAKQDGLPVLREAITDTDEELATTALRFITIAVDKACTHRARSVLEAKSPRVRAAAAEFLGHVAGVTVRPELTTMLQDRDAGVRKAAKDALDRIAGLLPKRAPAPWWEKGAEGAKTESPTAFAEPVASTDAPPAPPQAPAVPAISAATLIRQLGTQEGDIPEELLASLRELPSSALAEVLRAFRPGGEEVLGRGLARTAAALEISAWTTPLRRMLSDRSPSVRAEAARTLGKIGRGPALIPTLATLLSDSEPSVRVAAVQGLGALGRTVARTDIIRTHLERLSRDPSEEVRRARDEALAAIE